MQGGNQRALITASGLADDMDRAGVFGDAFEQFAHPCGRVGQGERLGEKMDVEGVFGDIDAEVDNIRGHKVEVGELVMGWISLVDTNSSRRASYAGFRQLFDLRPMKQKRSKARACCD